MSVTLLHGDCLEVLPTLASGSVQMICTSPPYWRMRQYTDDPRELGQEPTPSAYVAALAAVFGECWRVLRDDGVLFLNLGDAYANDSKWGGRTGGKHTSGIHGEGGPGRRKVTTGLPPKSLIGLPWRVAFALQDQGWTLRSEIIWHKPGVMPESVTDRPTRDHETLFLFCKGASYFYDAEAIREEALWKRKNNPAWQHQRAKTNAKKGNGNRNGTSGGFAKWDHTQGRNARTVWSIATIPLRDGEHYAPMPQALAERCIRAGSRPGDTVLDPFAGSGTTGRAAIALGRHATLIDLGYAALQQRRLSTIQLALPE